MDTLRGGHCWCRWRANGAVRRGDFGQIGYRDYTPGGCHARSSDPAPSHHAVCRGVLVLIPDQPSRLLGLEFILTAGTFGVALLLLDRRALTQHASTDHLSRIVHGLSPNLMVTIGLVFAGGSLAIEWGGGLYWLVPTVILSVLGGVLSAWLFLVEQV